MRPGSAAIVVACLAALPAGARADVPSCGARAGLYASEAGLKVWVTRVGSLVPDDPLRPLSKDPLLVLQVVVNARAATAYGPDPQHLVQAVGPRQVEEIYAAPVRWTAEPLPDTLRVSSPDGSLVLEALRFQECGDAPKATRGVSPDAPAPARDRPQPASAPRPSRPMPQGAIRDLNLRP